MENTLPKDLTHPQTFSLVTSIFIKLFSSSLPYRFLSSCCASDPLKRLQLHHHGAFSSKVVAGMGIGPAVTVFVCSQTAGLPIQK